MKKKQNTKDESLLIDSEIERQNRRNFKTTRERNKKQKLLQAIDHMLLAQQSKNSRTEARLNCEQLDDIQQVRFTQLKEELSLDRDSKLVAHSLSFQSELHKKQGQTIMQKYQEWQSQIRQMNSMMSGLNKAIGTAFKGRRKQAANIIERTRRQLKLGSSSLALNQSEVQIDRGLARLKEGLHSAMQQIKSNFFSQL